MDLDQTSDAPTSSELPLLPLRDVVVYPHMVIPLFVGREKSIKALEPAMEGDKEILLVAQKNAAASFAARQFGQRRASSTGSRSGEGVGLSVRGMVRLGLTGHGVRVHRCSV